MKRIIILCIVVIFFINLCAIAEDNRVYLLAERIAGEMGEEPFIVRVAYGEVVIRGTDAPEKRKKPSQSDIRAAAAAYCNYNFSCGAKNVIRWKKAESTPLEMRSGVRLYDWFFYI